MNDPHDVAKRYVDSCRGDFWHRIFRLEADYLSKCLAGCRKILSIGCGPAFVEDELARRGFHVTGLDVSREALEHAPKGVRVAAGRAERMPFPDGAFDAVVCIASLQFVEDYRGVLKEAARVLRPGGRIVAMLLNPVSAFFRQRHGDPGSYVSKIRHAGIEGIEETLAARFATRGEYFLALDGDRAAPAADREGAALYVISGVSRAPLEGSA